jgi:hypothetical protein
VIRGQRKINRVTKREERNMAVNFVTYNTAEERLAAFRRSVSLRKEWEAKMAPAMKQYREKVSCR